MRINHEETKRMKKDQKNFVLFVSSWLILREERGIPVAALKSRSSQSGKKNVRQKMMRVMYGNLDQLNWSAHE
jgi:hypothetical protein